MDETGVSIVAQVAAKCATELVKGQPYATGREEFESWYRLIGPLVLDTVKKATVQPAPPVGQPTSATVAEVPQTNGNIPSCPNHGPMIPGPGQTKGKGPLWKCSESKWDFQRKEEVGCRFVIWPADDPVGAV